MNIRRSHNADRGCRFIKEPQNFQVELSEAIYDNYRDLTLKNFLGFPDRSAE
jgi:hypothetical protein